MFDFFKKRKPVTKEEEKSHPSAHDSFDDPGAIFELFTRITGMHFTSKEQITKQKLQNFCMRYQLGGFTELNDRLRQDNMLLQALIDYLTVNETYFFREAEQLDILKTQIKNTPGKMHILCAPCATGEEVYSIIISFLDAGITPERFKVTGIDINASAIEHAKQGLFSERSVNRVDPDLLARYFSKEENNYRVSEEVRRLSDFKRENIFDESFYRIGSFDVIFSRNLFIYFDEKEKRKAVEIFCSLLKTGGHMFFGHADNFDDPVCLTSEFIGRTRVYRKI